jgi:outer membrane protein assembly factor BamA
MPAMGYSFIRKLQCNSRNGMAKVEVYKLWGRSVLFAMLVMAPALLFSQYTLKINPVDKDSAFIGSLKLQTIFKSGVLCAEYVRKLPALMQTKGYVGASVDSVKYDSTQAAIALYAGERYKWAVLRTDSVEKELLAAASWNKKDFDGKYLQVDQLQSAQRRLLDHLENNGYPFAKIELDSIEIIDDAFHARLKVDKGPLYKIDSIRNQGPASISTRFLQRYLNIMNGSIYRKSTIQSISRKINELPFVEEQQPMSLTFLGTGSIVNLTLAPKRSSQINVLVGLLPATTTSANIYDPPRTKMQFTGEATINLRNALGNGETIGLNWQQIQVKSPRLNLLYQQSYLFGSPFGVNFGFDLFKKDSSFITINGVLGMQYAVSSNQSGSVFIQTQTSNLITVDTNVVIQTKRLPQEADVRSISLGVQYEGYTTNYRFNPTKGNEWQLSIAAGTKTVKKNSVIVQLKDKNNPVFDFNSLYDTVQLKSFQFRVKASAAHYFPLTAVSTIKTSITAGWFESPNIFRNELFQIGGYRLLRGFDEESIYASQFAVTTAEYRYLIGRNSFLFSFVDFGWARSTASSTNRSNTFIGGGLGMALETKAGIFNISFAAGKQNDVNFNLRQSKIHFGYVNFF